jgi:hypothetical protein
MKIRRYLVALMGGAVALAIGASGALAGGGSDTTGYQPASNGFNPCQMAASKKYRSVSLPEAKYWMMPLFAL